MARMTKSSQNYAVVNLIMRLMTDILLALSIVVMVTDTFKFVGDDGEEEKATFKDLHAFRYLVAASGIAFLYNFLQIVPAIYLVVTRKLLLGSPFALYFDFIADLVVGYVLGSSASAALAVAMEFKRAFHRVFYAGDEILKKIDSFFLKAEAAAALALVATLTMIVLSIISARFLFKS